MESKAEEYANLSALMYMLDCECEHLGILPTLAMKPKKDIKHFDPDLPPSKLHFPSVIETIESGSQGEKLYTIGSDEDFLCEIGPGTVYDKANVGILNTLKEQFPFFSFWKNSIKEAKVNKFYWTKTDNDGFYNIEDEDGNVLYPVLLQRVLYPVLKINEETDIIEKEERRARSLGLPDFTVEKVKTQIRMENHLGVDETGASKASIPSERSDRVIAMRLDSWPCDIKDDFVKRNVYFSKLTELPLFLVPKSHPHSKHPKVEWRLSFSMVEKEVMLNFPQFWRKAYLIIKDMCGETHNNPFYFTIDKKQMLKYYEPPLKSYHIKTVLMWVYEEQPDADQTNMLGLLRVILKRLLIAFEEMSLPNYFIPSQNIMFDDKKIDCEKIDIVKTMLRDLLNQDNLQRRFSPPHSYVTQFRNDDFRKKIPKNVCLAGMFLAEEYNACLASFCNLMSLMFHNQNNPPYRTPLEFVKRLEKLWKALFQLANILGLFERKEFGLKEFSNIYRSCDSYLDDFETLQNLPAANYTKNSFLDCSYTDWGSRLKESITGVKLDENNLQKLEENDITKWFDHIASVIKNGVEESRIPLNENCKGSNFECTECQVPCFSSYKETLTNPVKLFQKLYAGHQQKLRAFADKEIIEEEELQRMRLEDEERVRRYKEEAEKEEQRRKEEIKSREEISETVEQKEEVQQQKEKRELKKIKELIKQPTPRRSERNRAKTSKPY